ncbi:MAG: ribosome biogenesis GTPase Der [Alphaproteobacteria bacterium]|nr:ribosome biogenesis GTPase Der [Rickettsiales bacterium]
MITIAIVGRTNVGKTTIFNKLSKRRVCSIVHKNTGVTRDRQYASIDHKGVKLQFIDTAGLENSNTKKLSSILNQKMIDQTVTAINEARFCLFVVDGKSGIIAEDRVVYSMVKKSNTPFLLIVNKCENMKNIDLNEIYKIHNKEKDIVFVSAEHSIGLHLILKSIYNRLSQGELDLSKEFDRLTQEVCKQDGDSDNDNDDSDDSDDSDNSDKNINNKKLKPIRISIIGKPNAGKSTLINKIINKNRLITDETPGTTRDAIEVPFSHLERDIILIDTAGIRKKMSISEELEHLSVQASMRAIDFAHVVILMIDVLQPMEFQDKVLIDKVISEGRPVIICYNKWDSVKAGKRKSVITLLRSFSGQQKHWGCGFFTLSALKDKNLSNLLDEAIKRYEVWNRKIPTKKLNNWLHDVFLPLKESPRIGKRKLKLKFISQKSTRPPTFKISANFADVPANYEEFLKNQLVSYFEIFNVPLRIKFVKSKNPFAAK